MHSQATFTCQLWKGNLFLLQNTFIDSERGRANGIFSAMKKFFFFF